MMKSHLHCIVQCDELSKVIHSFKSYTARAIIDYFKERENIIVLKKLKENKLKYKTKSEYQVWQEGSHPEETTTDAMMHQKLEYLHNNPVRKGYVEEASDWYYPSAQKYECKQGFLNVELDW